MYPAPPLQVSGPHVQPWFHIRRHGSSVARGKERNGHGMKAPWKADEGAENVKVAVALLAT